MKPLIILPTEKTPEIRLGDEGPFLIAGRSIPENPEEIYLPVLDWIKAYLHRRKEEPFKLEFRLEYLNSGSTKFILEILRTIRDRMETGWNNVTLRWYFEEEDESIEEMGLYFRDYLKIPLEVIPVYT